jgi:hypothetical protein
LYEGRTRGKRLKYTYSDDEDDIYSDSTTARRSTRNTGTHTPAEPAGPTVTLSGRQVKSRQGGAYGESMLSGTHTPAVGGLDGASNKHEEIEGEVGGRPRRAAASNQGLNGWGSKKGGRHIEGYNDVDEMTSDDEDDASEQDYGDDEEEDDHVSLESDGDEAEDVSDEDEDEEMDDGEKKSLVVKLPVKTPSPERKASIKLSLAPKKDSAQPSNLLATTNIDNSQASVTTTQGGTSSAADSKENTQLSSLSSTNHQPASVPSESPSKPMNIPPKSPTHLPPMSPSLAFRGSPEKPPAFPPSINVSYGGS